ncbi:MAG: radical SAM protein [Clostridiales bacterium]|mgnify:CR=1 FL=1|jgi:TatD family-associated radical SAM protein|nr:radical SAM protein [Clostridiales bacterium]
MNNYVYTLGDALYINLTNRCTNSCWFCIRNKCPGVGGYDLWLDKEPTSQEVIDRIGDPSKYSEIVFCGYGEPMVRLDELITIARVLKEKGARIRINTNGQANLYHGKNIVPMLEGLVDVVSISLNAPTAEKYDELCRSIYGIEAFDAVLEFAGECVKIIPKVVFSVVDVLPSEDIEKCRRIAEETGVELRVRHMMR